MNQQQRRRQRKFHKTSRNGCSVCKKKHIRCDERKPLCTYCLRHGGDCEYDAGPDNLSNGRDSADSEEPRGIEDVGASLALFGSTLNDPFAGTDMDMPHRSRPLFQLFVNSRIVYNTPVDRDSNSFVVHKALLHPGFLHGGLPLTALQWAWTTGDLETIRVPYLYHKPEAIRYVNEALEHPEGALTEGTIAAVSSLALADV